MTAEPRFTRRFVKVWRRNFIVYRRIWLVNFLPPLFESFFIIAAFGMGLGGMVGQLSVGGESLGYTAFLAPGMIAVASMGHSFFENTYASFVRMYYQKTFDAMLATPLSLEEVIGAEIFWGATRAVIAATAMLAVLSGFGLVRYPGALLVPLLAFVGGLAFGSLGMFFTGIIPSIDMFNLPAFLMITPMVLLSGTFFPVDNMPGWGAATAKALPLYHLAAAMRAVCRNAIDVGMLANLAYLAVFAGVFFLLAIRGMRKRLIK